MLHKPDVLLLLSVDHDGQIAVNWSAMSVMTPCMSAQAKFIIWGACPGGPLLLKPLASTTQSSFPN